MVVALSRSVPLGLPEGSGGQPVSGGAEAAHGRVLMRRAGLAAAFMRASACHGVALHKLLPLGCTSHSFDIKAASE